MHPEAARKIHAREVSADQSALPLVAKASAQVMTRMTVVRIAVARVGFTSATPTLARIAVSAANKAESSAQMNQLFMEGDYSARLKSREAFSKQFRHPE